MKFYILKVLILASVALTGCTRNLNNLVPVGRYCGSADQEFPNPYDNENIGENFQEITPEFFDGQTNFKYRAQSVSLLFKNADFVPVSSDGEFVPDQQLMFSHNPVFNQTEISLETFNTSCARGLTPESSAAFQAIMPVQMELQPDLSWTSSRAMNYEVDYGPDEPTGGFLVNKTAEEVLSDIPADELDFDFVSYVFLEQIGGLTPAQQDAKENPDTATNEIFLQVQVSVDPEVYAQIRLLKYSDPAPTEAPEVAPKADTFTRNN